MFAVATMHEYNWSAIGLGDTSDEEEKKMEMEMEKEEEDAHAAVLANWLDMLNTQPDAVPVPDAAVPLPGMRDAATDEPDLKRLKIEVRGDMMMKEGAVHRRGPIGPCLSMCDAKCDVKDLGLAKDISFVMLLFHVGVVVW